MYNYTTIKEQAQSASDKTVSDFIVLASQNDPFYVGTPTQRLRSDWFLSQWERFGLDESDSIVHLRRLHYRLVSDPRPWPKTGKDYQNTDKDWGKLLQAAKWARYRGLVPFSRFEDKRNPGLDSYGRDSYHPDHYEASVTGGAYSSLQLPYISSWHWPSSRPVDLVLFIEKTTMKDALSSVCARYGIDVVAGMGELSITACHSYLQRLRQRNKRAGGNLVGVGCYISDFDPAGRGMPVSVGRKLQFLIDSEFDELMLTLHPLALTLDQVKRFDLPRVPVKASELRRQSFREAVGEGAVELDALEALYPGSLGDIVDNWASQYFDGEAAQSEADFRRNVKDGISEYEQFIKDALGLDELERDYKRAATKMAQYLDQVRPSVEEWVKSGVGSIEWDFFYPAGQLFDSKRDYVSQVDVFKAHQRGEFSV
jgi:predicted nucleic acid-binding Zn ribbon protein